LIGPVVEQPEYNMFCREKIEVEFSQLYKTVGLGTTIWSPLASGVLTGKYNTAFPENTRLGMDGLDWLKDKNVTEEKIEKVKQLASFAKELGVSLPVLSIAWCLKNPNVSTVILGASKAEQLKENFNALDFQHQLTSEMMTKIENILQNTPRKPDF